MQNAVRRVLSRYASFSGRASRPEYWWWTLFVVVLMSVASLLDRWILMPLLGLPATDPNAGQPLTMISALAVLLPNLAVAVRRLHDTNRAGWWLFVALVPIVGGLVLLYFYVQPSDAGRNGHGDPDPLQG